MVNCNRNNYCCPVYDSNYFCGKMCVCKVFLMLYTHFVVYASVLKTTYT